ncbi:MAG: hypothetical protein A3K19_14840 [Lentisphaerae bacterium RIFOXYB12_FULL_65_16]|nr:MAG: hypothetical protein A3K18_27400 [Lentisphaerae bacterium RIFOXYA12_64_32]OGV85901.1 MAG: hypothetical protein A3K19_14840 [Lentisphaerae bacterium RIFOXYB12_FULL_65_16]
MPPQRKTFGAVPGVRLSRRQASVPSAPPRFPDAPQVEHLEILELLGKGGMGTVYKAMDRQRDHLVAVKVLSAELALWDRHLQRFLREANNLIELSHPNIVKGYEVARTEQGAYFTMEYVDGKDLFTLLREQGPLPVDRILDIAKQATAALTYAQSKGKLHRDIKPANLLLGNSGVLKVSDFGLMKGEADPALTSASVVLGTPYYMSPELVSGCTDIDVRSDIYSLGASLYHILVGEPPFAGNDACVVMTKQVTDTVEIPRKLAGPRGDRFRYILAKMLAKRREMRYQTPDELLLDLENIEAPEEHTTAELVRPKKGAVVDPLNDLFHPPTRERSRVEMHTVLSHEQIKAITRGQGSKMRNYPPGAVLFYETEKSRDFFILISGSCEVLQSGKCLSVISAPGSCFGEMASILGIRRTATVRTREESVCATVPASMFRTFLMEHPDIQLPLLEMALKRLCGANDRFVQSQLLIEDIRRQHLALLRNADTLTHDDLAARIRAIQEHLDAVVNYCRTES